MWLSYSASVPWVVQVGVGRSCDEDEFPSEWHHHPSWRRASPWRRCLVQLKTFRAGCHRTEFTWTTCCHLAHIHRPGHYYYISTTRYIRSYFHYYTLVGLFIHSNISVQNVILINASVQYVININISVEQVYCKYVLYMDNIGVHSIHSVFLYSSIHYY